MTGRMPTSRTEHSGGEAGFTLVEMLAVLAILALAATLVVGRVSERRTSDAVAVSIARSLALLRETRDAAIRSGRDQVAYVDTVDGRIIGPAPRAEVRFAPPSEVRLRAQSLERYPSGLTGVRFFGAGGSTGGAIAVEFEGRSRSIRIDWLTGRAWADDG